MTTPITDKAWSEYVASDCNTEDAEKLKVLLRKLESDLSVARKYVRTEWKAGRLQGTMSDDEIRVFQDNIELRDGA